jgi:DNA-directed RNA polymerase subunit M/transcription elongation factor TFIIS
MAGSGAGPTLRFCPESNDLLYPREDKERRVLVYFCRSCQYQEDADPKDWCVYRNEVQHTSREKTVVLQVRPRLDEHTHAWAALLLVAAASHGVLAASQQQHRCSGMTAPSA